MRIDLSVGTLLLLVPLLFGCERNEHPELRQVSGTVTYNGEPLEDAIVAFYNDNSSRLASGHTDLKGEFVLTSFEFNDGAIPGEHRVVVTKADVSEGQDVSELSMDEALDPRPARLDDVRLLVPKKYTTPGTTPLVLSVSEDGPNDVTIKLED